MKLTFYTNATCTYEHNGFRLLCDPWLSESAFYGSWLHDPPIKTRPEDLLDVDALYISHVHEDHCDPETLKHFRRDIPIVTLKDRLSICAKKLERMGFTDVMATADRHDVCRESIVGIGITIFGPFTKHPFHDCEIGNVVDSALLIKTGGVSILNCNDNTMTIEAALAFKEAYGSPTVAQLNWNNAGPYPACFANLSRDEKLAEANKAIVRNLDHMVAVAKALKPEFVMPFAGAYKLAPPRDHLNQYLGTTTPERAALACQEAGFKTIVLGEGESIDL